MKVLVQQSSTGLFYKGSHRWVADPDQALDFKESLGAFDFCVNDTTHDAQILLRSADPAASVVICPASAKAALAGAQLSNP